MESERLVDDSLGEPLDEWLLESLLEESYLSWAAAGRRTAIGLAIGLARLAEPLLADESLLDESELEELELDESLLEELLSDSNEDDQRAGRSAGARRTRRVAGGLDDELELSELLLEDDEGELEMLLRLMDELLKAHYSMK